MRKFLIVPLLVGVAAPALAQQPSVQAGAGASAQVAQPPRVEVAPPPPMDPRDEAIIRSVPGPQEIERVGDVTAATVDAILDVPIGPLREAIEGRRLSRREREETLGDHARKDDPYFRERMRDQITVAGAAVGVLAEQMAVMTPVLRQTLEDAQRRVEEAARGVPPRDYDRRYDRRDD